MFKFGFFDEPQDLDQAAKADGGEGDSVLSASLSKLVEYRPPSQPWSKQQLFTGDPRAGQHEGLVQLVAHGASGTADGTALSSITSHLDVKPGVYEGGFKTWECTKDLIRFMAEPSHELSPGASVLDLGCGPGLAGCAALQQGCNVLFQDLNADVLAASTCAHIHANCSDRASAAVLLAGTWAAQAAYLQQEDVQAALPTWASSGQFDVILSSETLYREAYLGQLLHALLAAMAPHTTVLLATKRFYFGVGGGTRPWLDYLAKALGEERAEPPAAAAAGAGESGDRSVLLYTSPPLERGALRALNAEQLAGRRLLLHRVQAIADGGSNVRDILRMTTEEAGQ